jgi:hypothetical protein
MKVVLHLTLCFQRNFTTCNCPIYASTKNSMASRSDASIERTRHLFRHRLHLSQRTPFSRRTTITSSASWIAHGGRAVQLAVRSMGGLFKSLPFRRALARGGTGCFEPGRYVEDTALQNRRMSSAAFPPTHIATKKRGRREPASLDSISSVARLSSRPCLPCRHRDRRPEPAFPSPELQ